METSNSARFVVPVLALLLLATVVADVARRALRSPERTPGPAASPAAGAGGRVAADSGAGPRGFAPPPVAAARLDPASRQAALQRIALGGDDTYLAAMLAEGDSVLHRWSDARAARPLLVWVQRGTVAGFTAAFTAAVATAVAGWNAAGLPVRLEATTDSATADIVVAWSPQLDGNRTGRADLTWRRQGPIVHADITLSTHLPGGQAVVPVQMVALALHEMGHALGLDHSPDHGDAMYPEASASEPTLRDRRTALLLYSLPPGDLK